MTTPSLNIKDLFAAKAAAAARRRAEEEEAAAHKRAERLPLDVACVRSRAGQPSTTPHRWSIGGSP